MAEDIPTKASALASSSAPRPSKGHVNNVFRKLDIGHAPDSHRRVLAVLTFLPCTRRRRTCGAKQMIPQ
jgi:hypothetical protein